MKVIFAQGNPESKFDHTRHNVGFFVIDQLAKEMDGVWKKQPKLKALTSEIKINGEKILLVKPQTYYNETGESARQVIDFYKLDASTDFLVIHDDLALPLGTIRIRHEGSDAGNNGVKSLNAHIGEVYTRIRIGIWNERRDQMDDAMFVLGKFSSIEQKKITEINDHILELVTQFISGALDDHSLTL